MLMYMEIFVILLLLFSIVYCICIMIRNDKVLKFRLNLINKIYDRIDVNTPLEIENKLLSLLDEYSYEKMLMSFKRLTLETWFTKEEIGLLNGDD